MLGLGLIIIELRVQGIGFQLLLCPASRWPGYKLRGCTHGCHVYGFLALTQTFQNPLIKEYTLIHIRDPITI